VHQTGTVGLKKRGTGWDGEPEDRMEIGRLSM